MLLLPSSSPKQQKRSLPPDESEIAARAYLIYLENGRQDGYALDHWLQAEYELMQLPLCVLASLPTQPVKKRLRGKSIVEIAQALML